MTLLEQETEGAYARNNHNYFWLFVIGSLLQVGCTRLDFVISMDVVDISIRL